MGIPMWFYLQPTMGCFAFALEEDTSPGTVIGEELWAWIPGYPSVRSHDATWAGRLIDQMLYGRTFLFDGTPVIEDVWIDSNGDGQELYFCPFFM